MMKHLKKFKIFESQEKYDIFDAIENNDIKTIKEYFDNDGDPNIIDFNKNNLLTYACKTPDIIDFDIIKLLIDNGVDVNYDKNNRNTPLILCSYYNKIDECKLLIDAGADMWFEDMFNHNSLYFIFKHKNDELLQWLKENYYSDWKKFFREKKANEFNL